MMIIVCFWCLLSWAGTVPALIIMSGQGAPPYPIDLTPQDLTILHSLWGEYYEAQPFSEDDGRLQVVACLKGFFFTTGGQQLVKRSCDLSVPSCTATFDYSLFCDLFQVCYVGMLHSIFPPKVHDDIDRRSPQKERERERRNPVVIILI